MQLKSWDRPGKCCGRFFNGLIYLTDRGFELQLVPPDMRSKALKRGAFHMNDDNDEPAFVSSRMSREMIEKYERWQTIWASLITATLDLRRDRSATK